MLKLSRYNELETLWDDIKQNNVIPDEFREEIEKNFSHNKLEVNVSFRNHRVGEEALKHKLAENYGTISLVDPLLKDPSVNLDNDAFLIVTDPNGVIISSRSEDVVGYCCPAADLINSNMQLKNLLKVGNILEVHYDNGIRSQLVPIFNQYGEIQFFWGVSGNRPISAEVSNILFLAAQLVQQRYDFFTMIDDYTNSLLNAIPQCAVLVDENARLLNINRSCMELFKVSDKNMLKGMPFSHYLLCDRPLESLADVLDIDIDSEVIIKAWGEDVPCKITLKQPINTPYGKRMVMLYITAADQESTRKLNPVPVLAEQSGAFDSIAGRSPVMHRIKLLASRAAKSTATILIEGESGTGKELIAQAIHQESGRQGEFVAINCGAIPAELIQSELFGYEEGAFTGARRHGQAGKFEIAEGGTIFLDEIGEMPLNMQVSLLRFLQDKTITRVGSHISKRVDVRIIAATNRNLAQEVEKGNFREDLYYRLNVIKLTIPPLRERKEDIPLIAHHILRRLCRENGVNSTPISDSAMAALLEYDWPGNARELENTIERAFVLSHNGELAFDTLEVKQINREEGMAKIKHSLGQMEREGIEKYLRMYQGNVSKTAQALGITRQTLYRKMEALNIDRKSF